MMRPHRCPTPIWWVLDQDRDEVSDFETEAAARAFVTRCADGQHWSIEESCGCEDDD